MQPHVSRDRRQPPRRGRSPPTCLYPICAAPVGETPCIDTWFKRSSTARAAAGRSCQRRPVLVSGSNSAPVSLSNVFPSGSPKFRRSAGPVMAAKRIAATAAGLCSSRSAKRGRPTPRIRPATAHGRGRFSTLRSIPRAGLVRCGAQIPMLRPTRNVKSGSPARGYGFASLA